MVATHFCDGCGETFPDSFALNVHACPARPVPVGCLYTQDHYRNASPIPECLIAHVRRLALEDAEWRRAAEDSDEESLAFRLLRDDDWRVGL